MSRKNIGIKPEQLAEFAKNFNSLCKGKNNHQIAKELKVDDTSVDGWREGKRLPDGYHLLKIKEHFDTNIDWLLTGKKHLEKSPPQIYDSDPMWKHFKEVIEENVKLKEELASLKKPWDGKTFKRKNSGE